MTHGHRREQMASEIRRGLQELIARGLNDPRIGGLITLTEVRLSPDLKWATVMVSVLPDEKTDLTVHGLAHSARHLRRQLMGLVGFQQMPELSFKADRSLKRESEVFAALARARQTSRPGLAADGAPTNPPGGTPAGPEGPGPGPGAGAEGGLERGS
ncbi:MAG TPA: 30S ribosome-binding factor RbfA [Phycisphaerales bacterium]|nr:30S ribosome-binding factor RbfA [Phycisphaerales bacterium]